MFHNNSPEFSPFYRNIHAGANKPRFYVLVNMYQICITKYDTVVYGIGVCKFFFSVFEFVFVISKYGNPYLD